MVVLGISFSIPSNLSESLYLKRSSCRQLVIGSCLLFFNLLQQSLSFNWYIQIIDIIELISAIFVTIHYMCSFSLPLFPSVPSSCPSSHGPNPLKRYLMSDLSHPPVTVTSSWRQTLLPAHTALPLLSYQPLSFHPAVKAYLQLTLGGLPSITANTFSYRTHFLS